MVSDNTMIFQNTEQWLQNIHQQAYVNNLLGKVQITGTFNLLRSPWWKGFYEKWLVLPKTPCTKTLGKRKLSFLTFTKMVLQAKVILTTVH